MIQVSACEHLRFGLVSIVAGINKVSNEHHDPIFVSSRLNPQHHPPPPQHSKQCVEEPYQFIRGTPSHAVLHAALHPGGRRSLPQSVPHRSLNLVQVSCQLSTQPSSTNGRDCALTNGGDCARQKMPFQLRVLCTKQYPWFWKVFNSLSPLGTLNS